MGSSTAQRDCHADVQDMGKVREERERERGLSIWFAVLYPALISLDLLMLWMGQSSDELVVFFSLATILLSVSAQTYTGTHRT